MKIKVNGTVIGEVVNNRRLTLTEAMYAIGYDINDQDDCKSGFENGVEGFYIDDDGEYRFDVDAAELDD